MASVCTRGNLSQSFRHNARVVLSCEARDFEFLAAHERHRDAYPQVRRSVHGTKARILDTRKTAPGLRVIDKYAVRCGGGQNHRLDLSDGVLIKNNHIALAGGVVPAVERALHNRRGAQPVEVELRTLQELEQVLANGGESHPASTTCRRKPWLRPLSTVHGWNAAFRWSAPEVSVWRMSAATRRPAWILSRWDCLRIHRAP